MANASTVTNVGLGLITALLAASTHKYVGWGVGITEANVTDVGLETASVEDRTSGTQTQQTTTTADDTYRVVATIVDTVAAKAITEVVIMSASTAGSCLMRANFGAINVEPLDSVQFTINNVVDQSA